MPELQLEGLAPERQAQNLMAEADAEDRLVGLRQLARVFDGVADRGRVAGAVAEENAVHAARDDLFGRGRRRHHVHVAAVAGQAPQDVPLDPEVVGGDAQGPLRFHLRRQRQVVSSR